LSLSFVEVFCALRTDLERKINIMTRSTMGISEISQFYVGKNIFITGATGELVVLFVIARQ
jgi:hypothetical protein